MSQDTHPLVLEREIDRLFDAGGSDQAFGKLAPVFGFRFHNTVNLIAKTNLSNDHVCNVSNSGLIVFHDVMKL